MVAANRFFVIANPALYSKEVAMVIPSVYNAVGETSNGSDTLDSPGMPNGLHTVVQVTRNITMLPFYDDYSPKKDIIVEGESFRIEDFEINFGAFRLNQKVYIIVQIHHWPCKLPVHSLAYRDVMNALSIPFYFPHNKMLDTILERYEIIISQRYGLMHQGIEMTELFLSLAE